MKYLIWLVIALAVIVWFYRARKALAKGAGAATGAGAGSGARKPRDEAETMVQCTYCGLHFPASEALTHASGTVYCSEEHLRLASS